MKLFNQPSVMSAQKHFSHVPSANIERSRFDRSHSLKTTLNAGQLVPIYVDEVLPGDTFSMHDTVFARLSTPLKPVMDNMFLETFYFFVPYRLLWDNWQAFCGERKNPDDDPSLLTLPTVGVDLGTIETDDLIHYLGIPMGGTGVVQVSAFPMRAYLLIWTEWFRDQNLIDSKYPATDDGPDIFLPLYKCLRRGKRHDYFTSCLPWPQKGDPVLIPVDNMVIEGSGYPINVATAGDPSNIGALQVNTSGQVVKAGTNPGTVQNLIWNDPKLQTSLELSTGATINDLRTAFQIQRLLERDARGGTRYIELVLSHFGVRSDDARLQRPEYLGGSSARVNINPVPATFHNTEVAQGDLAGFGTVINRGSWNKSFTEHGVIIGLACVRADLTYQQGIDRFWFRRSRFDFYWPALAHLGEQAVLNREIYFSGNTVQDETVFGYQERYAEYRYKQSRISGKFVSADSASLDVWHLGQEYASVPLLNEEFIQENPPMDRILAVPTEPHFLVDIWFALQCARPMPVYSVPGMSDHF